MSNVSLSLLKGARQALVYAKGKKLKAKAHKITIPMEVDVKTIQHKFEQEKRIIDNREN